MPNGSFLRVAALLPCLALPACMVTGEPDAAGPPAAAPAASAVASPPAPAPVSSAASPPTARWGSGGGGGARGGATTAAARGEPVEVGPDILTQARAACWMKVEGQKGLRDIDRRSAFVDKCVAEQLKSNPNP
jgi:hypothetical protein